MRTLSLPLDQPLEFSQASARRAGKHKPHQRQTPAEPSRPLEEYLARTKPLNESFGSFGDSQIEKLQNSDRSWLGLGVSDKFSPLQEVADKENCLSTDWKAKYEALQKEHFQERARLSEHIEDLRTQVQRLRVPKADEANLLAVTAAAQVAQLKQEFEEQLEQRLAQQKLELSRQHEHDLAQLQASLTEAHQTEYDYMKQQLLYRLHGNETRIRKQLSGELEQRKATVSREDHDKVVAELAETNERLEATAKQHAQLFESNQSLREDLVLLRRQLEEAQGAQAICAKCRAFLAMNDQLNAKLHKLKAYLTKASSS